MLLWEYRNRIIYLRYSALYCVCAVARRFIVRRKISLLAGALAACALCACSAQNAGDSGSQAASSASQTPAPEESPAASSDTNSDATTASSASSQPAEETYTLTRYDSIYDVPYAKLDYVTFDGDDGHYSLTKDGEPWVGTPGADQFGNVCFSDGHNFYIQCFLSDGDTLTTDFRWFCANLNHFDDSDPLFLPDETMNQLFIGADGDTLYTADGYEYKLSTVSWCQDGTCKR